MGLGDNIRHLRTQRGLTLAKVSERSGLAVSYLSRVETGRISPKIPTLRRIAKALEVNADELISLHETAELNVCPIVPYGKCYLDTPLVEEARFQPGDRATTRAQLDTLSQAADLLNRGDQHTRETLSRLVRALFESRGR
ncbi:MAG: helix-turn-helix transcriptional regulator [Deltaproteobacteria bacterium]|nr:helix-turn-helix transcriptional regulator [Deltaproteobacteria bacterium]